MQEGRYEDDFPIRQYEKQISEMRKMEINSRKSEDHKNSQQKKQRREMTFHIRKFRNGFMCVKERQLEAIGSWKRKMIFIQLSNLYPLR